MQDFIDIHSHSALKAENTWKLQSLFPEDVIPNAPFSIGIHPWKIAKDWQIQMRETIKKSQDKNCFAIGECGLDKTIQTPLKVQQEIFKAHIQRANELKKPLVIHCVKAHSELLQFYKDIKVPVILHDFSKNATLGKQLQNKGIYLSVGKALFRPSFAKVLPLLDKERIFLETDDSKYSIREIYQQAALLFQCDLLTLQKQIHTNFKKIF